MKRRISEFLLVVMFFLLLPTQTIATTTELKGGEAFNFQNDRWTYSTGSKLDSLIHKFKISKDGKTQDAEIDYQSDIAEPTYTLNKPLLWNGKLGNVLVSSPSEPVNIRLFKPVKAQTLWGTQLFDIAVQVINEKTLMLLNIYMVQTQEVNEGCSNAGIYPAIAVADKGSQRACFYDASMMVTLANNGYGNLKNLNTNWRPYISNLYSLRNQATTIKYDSSNSTSLQPTAEKLDTCKSKKLTGTVTDNYPAVIESLKKEMLNQATSKEAKDELSKYLDGEMVSKETDQQLYKMFYQSTLPGNIGNSNSDYVDRIMNDPYKDNFLALYQKSELDKIFSFVAEQPTEGKTSEYVAGGGVATVGGVALSAVTVSKALGMTASLAESSAYAVGSNAAGEALLSIGAAAEGTSAAAAGVAAGAAAIIVPVLIVAAVYIATVEGVKLWERSKNQQYFNSIFELILADFYIEANRNYQKCTGTWEKYPTQQDAYAGMSLLKGDALSGLKEELDKIGGTCPESVFKDPRTWFKSSLCGLGLALHEAGVNFMNFAETQLKAVLGMSFKGY